MKPSSIIHHFLNHVLVMLLLLVVSCGKICDDLADRNKYIRQWRREKQIESIHELRESGKEEHIPILMRLLRDKDGQVQTEARDGLISFGETAVGYLIPLLDDPDENERRAAVSILSSINSPKAFAALDKIVHDESGVVRQTLALGLSNARFEGAVPLLTQLMNDSNVTICERAIKGIGRIKPPGAAELIEQYLDHASHRIRITAAHALGTLADRSVMESLAILLADSSPRVVSETAKALTKIGDPRAVKHLSIAWENSRNIDVARALASFGFQPEDPSERIRFHIDLRHWDECIAAGEAALKPLKSELKRGNKEAGSALGRLITRLELDPEAILSEHLCTSSKTEWCAAIEALAAIKDTTAIPILVDQLKRQDMESRERIIQILGKRNDPRALEAVITTLRDDGEKAMRIEAARALAGMHDSTASAKPLIAALDDPDCSVQASAARSLGTLKVRSAVPELFRMMDEVSRSPLHDSYRNHLLNTLMVVLSEFGDRRIEPLVTEFVDSPSSYLAAARALYRIGGNESVDLLIRMLKWAHRKENLDVGYPVADALGRIGDPQAIEPLIQAMDYYNTILLDAPTPPGPFEALVAMGERAIGPLHDALDDRSPIVRAGAAHVLSWIEGGEAAASIAELLDDQDIRVRKSAIAALGNIGGPQVMPHLVHALNDPDDQVRTSAIETLSNHVDSTITSAVRPALNDPNGAVRSHAASILGKLRDREAVASLIECAFNDSADARLSAIRALGRIKDERALPVIRKLLTAEEARVRGYALEALLGISPIPSSDTLKFDVDSLPSRSRLVVGTLLARSGNSRGFDMLDRLLDSEKPYIRIDALDSLAAIDSSRAFKPLLAAATDSNDRVRHRALYRLATLGDDRATVELFALASDSTYSDRFEALAVLGETGDHRCFDPLVSAFRMARRERNQGLLGTTIRGLGYLGDERALEDLVPFAREYPSENARGDCDFWIYYALCYALGRIGGKPAVECLVDIMDLCSGEYADEAVGALEKIGPPDAIPALRKALQAYDTYARMNAAKILRSWGQELRPE